MASVYCSAWKSSSLYILYTQYRNTQYIQYCTFTVLPLPCPKHNILLYCKVNQVLYIHDVTEVDINVCNFPISHAIMTLSCSCRNVVS